MGAYEQMLERLSIKDSDDKSKAASAREPIPARKPAPAREPVSARKPVPAREPVSVRESVKPPGEEPAASGKNGAGSGTETKGISGVFGVSQNSTEDNGRGCNRRDNRIGRRKSYINFTDIMALPWIDIICVGLTIFGLVKIGLNFDEVTLSLFMYIDAFIGNILVFFITVLIVVIIIYIIIRAIR